MLSNGLLAAFSPLAAQKKTLHLEGFLWWAHPTTLRHGWSLVLGSGLTGQGLRRRSPLDAMVGFHGVSTAPLYVGVVLRSASSFGLTCATIARFFLRS